MQLSRSKLSSNLLFKFLENEREYIVVIVSFLRSINTECVFDIANDAVFFNSPLFDEQKWPDFALWLTFLSVVECNVSEIVRLILTI